MDDSPISGDTHLHRYEVHKRVGTRLQQEGGVTTVEAKPSPMRPVRLVATLDCAMFFDRAMAADEATLEFEWRPHAERDEFRIQYNEPGTAWSCGWHQDETHEKLGSSHFQVDHETWETPHRDSASFSDPNPMAILETCLNELRDRVPELPESVRPDP